MQGDTSTFDFAAMQRAIGRGHRVLHLVGWSCDSTELAPKIEIARVGQVVVALTPRIAEALTERGTACESVVSSSLSWHSVHDRAERALRCDPLWVPFVIHEISADYAMAFALETRLRRESYSKVVVWGDIEPYTDTVRRLCAVLSVSYSETRT